MNPVELKDLPGLVGQEVGVSDWLEITQERVNQFAEATGDHQWIHVDVERATKEIGGPIAHGYLTLSLISVTAEALLLSRLAVRQVLNYGLDKVRFLAPVRAGKRVRNRIRLLALEDKGADRHLLTMECTFEIEGEERPALLAVSLVMLIV